MQKAAAQLWTFACSISNITAYGYLVTMTDPAQCQGVAELRGRPVAIANFDTSDIVGSVAFLPEPGRGVHVFANLYVKNKQYCNKTLGMHIHSKVTGTHFDAGLGGTHGVWPAGHAGDLHNNIVVTPSGRVVLAFVDTRLSVSAGSPRNIIGHHVVIHKGPDDCGLSTEQCALANGCAGDKLADAVIYPYGIADICV